MLRYAATLPEATDWHAFQKLPSINEVLLEHRALARTGQQGTDTLKAMAEQVRKAGLAVVLVWDVLVSDHELERGAQVLQELIPFIDAVRVLDPGVAFFVQERYPALALHLILETGNHNLTGITTWVRELKPERVVLSNELPLSLVAKLRPQIRARVEMPVLGRLLIFYTPRKLLRADHEDEDGPLFRYVTSDQDRKHFPILENDRGTFMYYEKDLFLLPWADDMEQAGIDIGRLDLKHYTPSIIQPLGDFLVHRDQEHRDRLKACLGPRVTRGFFKSNRTDKQFEKLNNLHLMQRDDALFLGTVLETRKKKYAAIMTEQPVTVGSRVCFIIPEGQEIEVELQWMRKVDGQPLPAGTRTDPGLWLVNPVPRISSGTRCYLA